MTKHILNSYYNDYYEYHGNTTVELIRMQGGITIDRKWIIFNTPEEAIEFFNNRYDA